MLIKGRLWIRGTFEQGSRPSLDEVRSWVISGSVPGRIINDRVFVDADRFALNLPNGVETASGVDLLR